MVDILMATYNGEEYIKEQLDSILNQSYTNFTLHISDDKSTDNTINIIKEYAKLDSRIKLHLQDINLGYIKNFEYLLSISKENYIMLCDQDDVWLNNKIDSSVKKIDSGFDLVIANMKVVDKSLKIINNSYFDYINIKVNDNLSFKDFLFRNPCAGCSLIFKKHLIDKILPFPDLVKPYYIHDWYLLIIGAANGKVGFINESLSLYRQHDNNNVGMNKKFNTGLKFYSKARSINIGYRYNFMCELEKKIDNIEITKYKLYLESIKKTKFINFNFKSYFRYTKIAKITPKIKYLFVFHFPLIILSINKEEVYE